jgi:hypothetical protein
VGPLARQQKTCKTCTGRAYIIEFKTAADEALAISIPGSEAELTTP